VQGTDHELSAEGGTRPADSSAEDNAPWVRPLAPWKLYLLIFFSSGIYLLFWTARLALEMRRHLDPKVKPLLHVLGLFLPFVGLFVLYRQASLIRQLSLKTGSRTGASPTLIVVIAVALSLVAFAAGRVVQGGTGIADLADVVVGLALLPVPWLVMQGQLNRSKRSLIAPVWLPGLFSRQRPKYVVAGAGAAVFAWVAFGLLLAVGAYFELVRARGEHLEAGAPISGTSGWYTVTPAGEGWVRVSGGVIDADGDLEVYGPTTDTWAIVYVDCVANARMDAMVEFRRNQIEPDSFSEERRMLPDAFVPVSYARYAASLALGERRIWWIALVATDKAVVELVTTTSVGAEEPDLERTAKSLRLTGKADEQCGSS